MKKNEESAKLVNGGRKAFDAIRVLCRIVTSPDHAFVGRVTVNNNRQNPVEPWNLRANDLIQLRLQDKFRIEIKTYYERQKNAFESLDAESLEETGIDEHSKPIELLKLAQTFAITDGQINRLSEMRTIFEEDRYYNQVFRPERLRAHSGEILLCYKVQFKLAAMARAIVDRGPRKYWYANRARHLIWGLACQAILNDKEKAKLIEEHGTNLITRANFVDHLIDVAKNQVTILLGDLLASDEYKEKVDAANLSFLRTDSAFTKCMRNAHGKLGWVHKKLDK